jgi:NADPH:quinone reductase
MLGCFAQRISASPARLSGRHAAAADGYAKPRVGVFALPAFAQTAYTAQKPWGGSMKKVILRRFGGPEVIEVVTEPDPAPGPDEVVVKSHAMAVGWPDILIRNGGYKWAPPLPITLGQESTGTIAAVGSGVTGLKIGQPVYVSSRETGFQSGCYNTMRLTPARAVMPLPEGTDLEQAVGLGYFSLAWALMFETTRGFKPKSMLVVGAAGGAGTALTQVGRAHNMLVIGTVSSDEKAAFAKSNGADHTINYKTENVLARVLEITGGKGVDLILDPVMGPKFTDNFKMLNYWGTCVTYNAVGGPPGPELFQTIRSLAERCQAWRYFSMHVYEDDPEGRRRILKEPIELLFKGKLKTHIAGRFKIDDIRKAHEMLEGSKALGKIVVTP